MHGASTSGSYMKSHLINDTPKTYALIFDPGDEVMEGLVQFGKEHRVGACQLSGIGALDEVTVGFFIPAKKNYKKITIREQMEVLSLLGDISLENDEAKVHAHIVLGKADASAHGGHLVSGRVNPTLEVIITESPAHLRRQYDPRFGLALIELPAK